MNSLLRDPYCRRKLEDMNYFRLMDDNKKAQVLKELGNESFKRKRYLNSQIFYSFALESLVISDSVLKVQLFGNAALSFFRTDQLRSALLYSNRGIVFDPTTLKTQLISGKCYEKLGEYFKSYECYKKCVNLCEERNDSKSLSTYVGLLENLKKKMTEEDIMQLEDKLYSHIEKQNYENSRRMKKIKHLLDEKNMKVEQKYVTFIRTLEKKYQSFLDRKEVTDKYEWFKFCYSKIAGYIKFEKFDKKFHRRFQKTLLVVLKFWKIGTIETKTVLCQLFHEFSFDHVLCKKLVINGKLYDRIVDFLSLCLSEDNTHGVIYNLKLLRQVTAISMYFSPREEVMIRLKDLILEVFTARLCWNTGAVRECIHVIGHLSARREFKSCLTKNECERLCVVLSYLCEEGSFDESTRVHAIDAIAHLISSYEELHCWGGSKNALFGYLEFPSVRVRRDVTNCLVYHYQEKSGAYCFKKRQNPNPYSRFPNLPVEIQNKIRQFPVKSVIQDMNKSQKEMYEIYQVMQIGYQKFASKLSSSPFNNDEEVDLCIEIGLKIYRYILKSQTLPIFSVVTDCDHEKVKIPTCNDFLEGVSQLMMKNGRVREGMVIQIKNAFSMSNYDTRVCKRGLKEFPEEVYFCYGFCLNSRDTAPEQTKLIQDQTRVARRGLELCKKKKGSVGKYIQASFHSSLLNNYLSLSANNMERNMDEVEKNLEKALEQCYLYMNSVSYDENYRMTVCCDLVRILLALGTESEIHRERMQKAIDEFRDLSVISRVVHISDSYKIMADLVNDYCSLREKRESFREKFKKWGDKGDISCYNSEEEDQEDHKEDDNIFKDHIPHHRGKPKEEEEEEMQQSMTMKNCFYCSNRSAKLKLCSGCRIAMYCSRSCQVLHWKSAHKSDCKKMKKNNV